MAQQRSPGYPGMDLGEAIEVASKLYSVVRTGVTDREAAAKDLGYSGLTGSSAKALADLVHYGLLERAGKGGIRISQRTVNILWGEPHDKQEALAEAAVSPSLFADLQQQFPEAMPSENQLKGFLHRRGFADVAIPHVIKSYTGTRRLAEEAAGSKSHGSGVGQGPESVSSTEAKTETMPDTNTLERPAPTVPQPVARTIAPAMDSPQLNRIDMNIQGNKVLLSGLLDIKGLDALEKKIAALRILLEVVHDANDTSEEDDGGQG